MNFGISAITNLFKAPPLSTDVKDLQGRNESQRQPPLPSVIVSGKFRHTLELLSGTIGTGQNFQGEYRGSGILVFREKETNNIIFDFNFEGAIGDHVKVDCGCPSKRAVADLIIVSVQNLS